MPRFKKWDNLDVDLIVAILLFIIVIGLWVFFKDSWLQRSADLILGVILGGLRAGMRPHSNEYQEYKNPTVSTSNREDSNIIEASNNIDNKGI